MTALSPLLYSGGFTPTFSSPQAVKSRSEEEERLVLVRSLSPLTISFLKTYQMRIIGKKGKQPLIAYHTPI